MSFARRFKRQHAARCEGCGVRAPGGAPVGALLLCPRCAALLEQYGDSLELRDIDGRGGAATLTIHVLSETELGGDFGGDPSGEDHP